MSEQEHNGEEAQKKSDPLAIMFPADTPVLAEARRLAGDKNSRVENLATICLQDPVIIIDLLKAANALFFAGGKSAITSPKHAIVRLGSDVVVQTLDSLGERTNFEEESLRHLFEGFRSRSKRIGIVSRLFAEALARTMSEDIQAAGCLFSVGDLLAVSHFNTKYLKLTEQHQRSGVNYRLAQSFKFDVELMGISYLRRNGVPEVLIGALDRDARPRSPDKAIMKPICFAASELVDAFDANKWEKLAPGKNYPTKSALRLLQMSESQYLKIYERASEYLFSAKIQEERRKQIGYDAPLNAEISDESEAEGEVGTISVTSGDSSSLDLEILGLLSGEEEETSPAESGATAVKEFASELVDVQTQFGLNKDASKTKTTPRSASKVQIVAPPKLRTKGGSEFVTSVSNIVDGAKSSEELLAKLMEQLIDGPFEKAALIVVSKDRKHAIVVAARGPDIGNGQKIQLNDPLSPLAQCFSKVQSFASRANEASPFGSKSFALAPIDADHDTPVALYADCGTASITFEGRRIFRTVVEILNQKLPSIPGGIPVELSDLAAG